MPPQTMRQFLKPPEKAPDTLPRTQSTMSLLDYFSTVIQGLADPTGWTEPKAEDFDNPHAYTQALKAHGVGQLLGMAAPLAAPLMLKLKGVRQGTSTLAEYQGTHGPPMHGSGAPLHDLTGGGTVYPDDVYSKDAARFYGQRFEAAGGASEDARVFAQLHALKDKPDARVTIYRAVPKDAPDELQHGDWVTLSRSYAKAHGESRLGGNYKIVKGEVPAKTVFANGDSPYEYGLDLSVLPPEKPPQTLKAFHGSPHDFGTVGERGAFKKEAIGSGEGGQAYSYGHYFAQNPLVSEEYKKALGQSLQVGEKKIPLVRPGAAGLTPYAEDRAASALALTNYDLDAAIAKTRADAAKSDRRKELLDPVVEMLEGWKKQGIVPKPVEGGHMYELNLHTSPEHLLDWDKPLSQQPQKVQEALAKIGITSQEDVINANPMIADLHRRFPGKLSERTGENIYQALVAKAGGRAGHTEGIASQQLADAGIHGVQYLDQGSRGGLFTNSRARVVKESSPRGNWKAEFYAADGTSLKGDRFPSKEAADAWVQQTREGTRNYVIFPHFEHLIEISKKYGISLPAAASLYKWQQSQKGVE